MTKNVVLCAVSITALLSGCATESRISQDQAASEARGRLETVSRGLVSDTHSASSSSRQINKVRVLEGSYLQVTDLPAHKPLRPWMEKRISLTVLKAMTLDQVIANLHGQGVKIISRVAVSGVPYRGVGVKETDAETAVKVLFGATGLDVEFDDANQAVVIVPMSTKTWHLGIANRKSTFRSGARGGSGSAATGAAGAQGSGTAGSSVVASSMQDMGQGSIEVTSDFWRTLKDDLKARVTVLMPKVPAPLVSTEGQAMMTRMGPTPMPMPLVNGSAQGPAVQQGAVQNGGGATAAGPLPPNGPAPMVTGAMISASSATQVNPSGSEAGPYEKMELGSVTVNEETGTVSARAPAWLLSELDTYLTKIIDSSSTTISFVGEIIAVETSNTKSSGLDISAFARFASGRFGAVVSNNALGGVTVSFPQAGSSVPAVSAGSAIPGSGSLVGITSRADGLSIFNSYLSQFGHTTVIQRPVVTTTSGVTGEFSRRTTSYYNNITQSAAAGGTGSAAVGTTNNLVPVEEGTLLRIVPLYNPWSRTIRAQIGMQQSVRTGEQTEAQLITVGNTVQQINTQIPIISRMSYSGEAVLKDGDLIVIGGMIEDAESSRNAGVRGTEGTPLEPVTRQGNVKNARTTYYVALRVGVRRED